MVFAQKRLLFCTTLFVSPVALCAADTLVVTAAPAETATTPTSGYNATTSQGAMKTDRPLALGFGFSRPEHIRAVGQWADAAVVGSALVQVVAEHGRSADLADQVERYVRWLQS